MFPQYIQYYPSPIGILKIEATSSHITAVNFVSTQGEDESVNTITQHCQQQLQEYFSGGRKIFSLHLQPKGTDFQQRVWTELQNIPFGKVASYLEMAKRLGDEKVIRAAAAANGKNPVAIIIPCHRVIGANGDLVGYAGGLDKKRLLLEHEGILSKPLF